MEMTTKSDADVAADLSGFRIVPIDDLNEDDANTRVHDEANLDAIRASIREFGQVEPLVVQKSRMKVIGGNGRLRVMREEGWTRVKIFEVDCDDDKASALSMILNRTAETSKWDPELVNITVQELNIDSAAIAEMLVDLSQSLEASLAGADTSAPETQAAEKVIPEMELLPYEHYDYLVILSKNQADWNWLLSRFGIEKVSSPFSKKKIGIGRAIWAGEAIKKIIGESNGRPEDRGAEQGPSGVVGEDGPPDS